MAQSLYGKDHIVKGVSVHLGSAQPRTKEATIMEGMCKEGHVVIMEEVVAVAGVMAMILGVETEINSVDLHLQCKEDTITRHSNLII